MFDLAVEAPDGATANINPALKVFGFPIHGTFGSSNGSTENINQGSQNVGFNLDVGSDWPLSAAQSTGKFTFTLTANEKHGTGTLSNTMYVNVVPVPAALPLLGGVFAALGLAGWRKRRLAAA
jgi:hypothetical protein